MSQMTGAEAMVRMLQLAAAAEHGGPALVDIITQPLHEARAPVSEWVA